MLRVRWGCFQCSGADENPLAACTVLNPPSLQMSSDVKVCSTTGPPSYKTIHACGEWRAVRYILYVPWTFTTVPSKWLHHLMKCGNFGRNIISVISGQTSRLQLCQSITPARLANFLLCQCVCVCEEITHMVAASEVSTRWQNVGVFCSSLYPPDGAWN